jgi:Cd2+/Zn2+-exporting ATPase
MSDTRTTQYRIDGLDCPDCAAKVEKVAGKVPGVSGVRIEFTGRTLSAQVESPKALERLCQTVKSLGYTLACAQGGTITSGVIQTQLQVGGMDCAEEKALVEKAFSNLPGLVRFEINLVSQRLTVVHDTESLPVAQLIAVLADAGLVARHFGAAQKQPGFWQRYGRILSTALAGLFTSLGLLLHWLAEEGNWEKGLFALAIISGGWFIARKGWAAARHGVLDMNVLMSVAIIGALFIDAWDEAAMVVFLFALAQVLEGRAMDRARNAVQSLMELAPPIARLLHNGKETSVAAELVQVGDIFRLRPGEKIPLDGEVVEGQSAVNQAPITGESIPVEKAQGDTVYAGSINGQGSLDVRVTRLASDTTLAHIIHLIEEAQAARAPSQAFVDRFARIYTPAVLVIALLITVIPPLMFGQPLSEWFYRALVLLVIACPCALVISTPVAIVSGLARGARAGVLIKGGMHLENAGRLRALAIDKTGTLTEGAPKVQTVIPLNETSEQELLRIAAGLESCSEHPLALAIREHAQQAGIEAAEVEGFQALSGLGVEGRIEGQTYLLGNHRFIEERGICSPEVESWLEDWERKGQTVVIIGSMEQVLGVIGIADSIRPEAESAMAELKRLGIVEITMLTGDNWGTAQAIAKSLDIDQTRAELLPADKVKAVQELVQRYGHVGMVGDGINDAPAMATATSGIAMGAAGTDAALETADLVLMGDDLSHLPFAIRLSRATLRSIRENIILALGLKGIFLALAIPGYATLWMAVFADMGASLLVIANSLRLLRMRS